MLDNQTYYDRFSEGYEDERHRGYHKLIDDLQVELISRACIGRDVLEVGCGTGALLRRIEPIARTAIGLDISAGMLETALKRGLRCVLGNATELPFADGSFDVVYSFKVLAHIEAIETTLAEVKRVLRPGGRAFLEFYNRRSLRYLVKRLAGPGKIAANTDENDVFTRWDAPGDCIGYLPPGLNAVAPHGVRIFTPAAVAHKVPGVALVLRRAEWFWRDRRPMRSLGGFYVLECEKS